MTVCTGLDRLVATDFAIIRGRRVGLVTHPAAVDRAFRSAADLFRESPDVKLFALFGPEHGLTGHAQDLEGVSAAAVSATGIRIHSLYGATEASLHPTREMLSGIDDLVIDLVDVGARYYTFQATMLYCLEAAAKCGLRVVILDRPNPLGGEVVEGPTLQPGFASFVGPHPICTRHGMTLGELAQLYLAVCKINVELEIVACECWKRSMDFADTGLPWVMPSPNMPTLDTAYVYPGMCLMEGTNLSEGRGTTRPFELVGFPKIDAELLATTLNNCDLPGVHFRPVTFKPTFQKHVGQLCGGLQLHVTDRRSFQPVRTGLAVLSHLRQLAGDRFAWRTEPYEFVSNPIAIDLLFGSARERQELESGTDWRDIAKGWQPEQSEFHDRRLPHLMY